jgi:N-acetyl-anhydromuramyl-L-alanine amidase AmpD
MKTFEEMRKSPTDNFPEWIVVHHVGGTDLNPLLDTSNQTFKIIQDYHLSLGWENIGYHWVIEKDGKMIAGRPETYHGAHTKEQDINSKSVSICLAGNFDATLPTKEQENALAGLIALILGRYPAIPPLKIVPHRYFTNKTCYGRLLADNWAKNLVVDKSAIKAKIIELLNTL